MLNYIIPLLQYNSTYRLLFGFDMLYYIKYEEEYNNAYQTVASGRPPCRDEASPEGSAREARLEPEGTGKPSRPAADAHLRHRVGEDRAPVRHASRACPRAGSRPSHGAPRPRARSAVARARPHEGSIGRRRGTLSLCRRRRLRRRHHAGAAR